jgi:hypothetical protein
MPTLVAWEVRLDLVDSASSLARATLQVVVCLASLNLRVRHSSQEACSEARALRAEASSDSSLSNNSNRAVSLVNNNLSLVRPEDSSVSSRTNSNRPRVVLALEEQITRNSSNNQLREASASVVLTTLPHRSQAGSLEAALAATPRPTPAQQADSASANSHSSRHNNNSLPRPAEPLEAVVASLSAVRVRQSPLRAACSDQHNLQPRLNPLLEVSAPLHRQQELLHLSLRSPSAVQPQLEVRPALALERTQPLGASSAANLLALANPPPVEVALAASIRQISNKARQVSGLALEPQVQTTQVADFSAEQLASLADCLVLRLRSLQGRVDSALARPAGSALVGRTTSSNRASRHPSQGASPLVPLQVRLEQEADSLATRAVQEVEAYSDHPTWATRVPLVGSLVHQRRKTTLAAV